MYRLAMRVDQGKRILKEAKKARDAAHTMLENKVAYNVLKEEEGDESDVDDDGGVERPVLPRGCTRWGRMPRRP